MYYNPGTKPPEASEFFKWTNVFLLENLLFWTLPIYRPGPTRGGGKTLSGGRAPWPHDGYGPVANNSTYYNTRIYFNINFAWHKKLELDI